MVDMVRLEVNDEIEGVLYMGNMLYFYEQGVLKIM